MVKRDNCDIYGPDLEALKDEPYRIAEMGLKCMKGSGVTSQQEKARGDESSENNLEQLTKSSLGGNK